ncbi:hypothetical protein OIV83_003054 [Microbotryomycetes sp. JL201]|nr:hypothetical protein OIV83_003054 [Microbotryomycetes sp. JL201]
MRTKPVLECTCRVRRNASTQAQKRERAKEAVAKRTRKKKAVPAHLPQTELFQMCANVLPISHRPSLINDNSARDLVRAWGVDKMHDVTILECYPGAGGLTRAFLELKNVKKVIAVEEAFRYMPMLEAAKANLSNPERLSIVSEEPFLWESYSKIEKAGLFDDVSRQPFEQIHDNFFLACQLPNIRHGEQLFVQFLSTLAGRMWLWKLGRFRMGFLGATSFFQKVVAPPGTTAHHKLSVLMPTLAEIRVIQTMSSLSPPEQHFHKPRNDAAIVQAIEVTPHLKPLVQDFEVLEYVTRSMFVAKSHPWTKGLAALASGATNLIPEMKRRGMPDEATTVNNLTLEHWKIISDVYTEWPFKENVMFDDGQWTMEA